MEKLLQIWTISGTSFSLRNTWRAANFHLLKIVRCIMPKEPTINASFGNMPETGGFHYHHQMEMGGPRMRWDILFQNWWRTIQLQKVSWNWLCAGVRRDATRDDLASELNSPARHLHLWIWMQQPPRKWRRQGTLILYIRLNCDVIHACMLAKR